MCNYLTKRGATYYFRRVIPDDVRPAFDGRKEWVFSLGTKDRKEGERKARLEAVRHDGIIADARSELAGTQAEPITISAPPVANHPSWHSQEEFEHFLEQDAHNQQLEWEEEERWPEVDALKARLQEHDDKLSPKERAIKDLLAQKNFEWTLGDEKRAVRATRQNKPSPPSAIPPTPQGARSGDLRLGAVADKWATEKTPDAKTIDRMRAVIAWFEERVGELSVSAITAEHVLDFKDALLTDTTAANAKVKLSNLRTLLNYAKARRLIPANPAADIFVTVKAKPGEKRREFDLAALAAIFGSPVYAHGERPVGGAGEAAYWLPLLALYTGARLNELGQLRPADVAETTYADADGKSQQAWVINITADAADGLRVKNEGSIRRVPIHPDLIALGFLNYVAASGAQVRLFPDLKPDKYGIVTANWSKWFNRYLREVCGVAEKQLVFHSFRHSFKHYARHRGIPKDVHDAITGHKSKDVADAYGPNYPLAPMVAAIRRYAIPGFALPPAPLS